MRATGMLKGQLTYFTLIQTGLMGLVAGLLALPIGTVLSLVLIYVVNVRSFGWTMQFVLLPGRVPRGFFGRGRGGIAGWHIPGLAARPTAAGGRAAGRVTMCMQSAALMRQAGLFVCPSTAYPSAAAERRFASRAWRCSLLQSRACQHPLRI